MSSLESCVFSSSVFDLLIEEDTIQSYRNGHRQGGFGGSQGSMWPHHAVGEGHILNCSVKPLTEYGVGMQPFPACELSPEAKCFPKRLPF